MCVTLRKDVSEWVEKGALKDCSKPLSFSMIEDLSPMPVINMTDEIFPPYPLWYFFNDSLVILGNSIGIFMACLFIFATIRLDHPSYSISNLIACNTCLAIALTNTLILVNACYALSSDFRGVGWIDPWCSTRGVLLNLFTLYMYSSLCLKAFSRLRCIVYYTRPIFTSYQVLALVILVQWCVIVLLIVPLLFTNAIDYDWGSHLCLVPIVKLRQFLFTSECLAVLTKRVRCVVLVSIYYVSLLFLSGVYFYILYYVLHLPMGERYRRRRQFALLRRILILLIMLLIPGVFSSLLLVRWLQFGAIPIYSFKISALLDTVGHTGSVLTIFISHTRIRRHYYPRTETETPVRLKTVPAENFD